MQEAIHNYYSNYDENGRLLSRHGQVEFLTTMRYVQKYLTPNSYILEIGAATGRYSHALARLGYRVDAVELVEHNIEIFNSNTQPGERIHIQQGDATDLSFIPDGLYDVTLLLGPMYHLFNEADKLQALSEAIRVTKPGGVVFAAYCMSDSSILQQGFCRNLYSVREFIEKGFINEETFEASSCPELLFEIVRKEHIDRLMENLPVDRLHYVATDLYTNHMRAAVDEMDDETFALYLKYHFAICERPDMVGLTHHSLDIFRKR